MITIAQAQALEPGDLVKHDASSVPLIVTMVDKGGDDTVTVSVRPDDGNPFSPKTFNQSELSKVSIVSSRGAGEAAPPPPPDQAKFLVERNSPLFEAPSTKSMVKTSVVAGVAAPLLVTTSEEDWFLILYKGEVGWVEADRGKVQGELFTVAMLPTDSEVEKSRDAFEKETVQKQKAAQAPAAKPKVAAEK